jgi:hypothetical protein
MSLRFQKEDEVDEEVKHGRRTTLWEIVAFVLLVAALEGVSTWLHGDSVASYAKELGWLCAIGFLCWLVSPIYQEFRIRTKEIHGKVSAIEAAVNADAEQHAESLEPFDASEVMDKLTTIEGKLDAAETQLDFEVKWDYRVITVNTQYEIVGDGKLENSRPSNEIIQSRLEEMGADGWELVSFLPAMPTDSKFRGEYANPWVYQFVFKRRAIERSSGFETEWAGTRNTQHIPVDIATEEDMSKAVSVAIQETRATSFAHRGLVIKAARGHLKGKSFDEKELQSIVGQVDALQRAPDKGL